MIDIVGITSDLDLADSQVPKAANVCEVQVGSLEYLPEFGIDLDFFIQEQFQFQNESFKSYLIQRLAENHVNVNECIELFESFVLKYTFAVGDPQGQTGGFVK